MNIRIQTLAFTILSLLLFSCKAKHHTVTKETFSLISIDSTIAKNQTINKFLIPYKQGKDSIMNVVIGKTAIPLSKSQPECTMGNFVADAQMQYSKQKDENVQVTVINQGGLRINYLAPGNITVGNIYEIMPFDNKLVILEVSGEKIDSLCNHIIQYGGWPISGLTFAVDRNKKAADIKINGKAIHPNIIYKVSTSDYLANGGDNCTFFLRCKRKDYNVFIRDILLESFKTQPNIHPTIENKIIYEQ